MGVCIFENSLKFLKCCKCWQDENPHQEQINRKYASKGGTYQFAKQKEPSKTQINKRFAEIGLTPGQAAAKMERFERAKEREKADREMALKLQKQFSRRAAKVKLKKISPGRMKYVEKVLKEEGVPMKWNCGLCTYENSIRHPKCVMCGKGENPHQN